MCTHYLLVLAGRMGRAGYSEPYGVFIRVRSQSESEPCGQDGKASRALHAGTSSRIVVVIKNAIVFLSLTVILSMVVITVSFLLL